ncbi:MAG: hypothetical protein RBS36_11320 [Thiomicrospira sp.]|jgi:hypothetical protein|nr:hypothetical protein [Thiomicrospira sp.]
MKDVNDTATAELEIKPVSKTNAQRQREYRERNRSQTARVDVRLDWEVVYNLDALAVAHGLTQKAMLERLINDTHEAWRNTVTDEEIESVNEKLEQVRKVKGSRKEKLAIHHSDF